MSVIITKAKIKANIDENIKKQKNLFDLLKANKWFI